MFGWNRWGAPYEKDKKILSRGTCAHEGEVVAMKAKIVDFWLKPVGGTVRKNWRIISGETCGHEA